MLRYDAAAVSFTTVHGAMYVFGGSDGKNVLDETWMFDPASGTPNLSTPTLGPDPASG